MKVAIILAFLDQSRTGLFYRSLPRPQIGPLIAALLPREVDIDIVNETLEQPDWDRDYDLVFISSLHSDFDRARQLSHYWRRRGAKTVYGGPLASAYPDLCQPFFDAVAIGDAEGTVPQIYMDLCAGDLRPVYFAVPTIRSSHRFRGSTCWQGSSICRCPSRRPAAARSPATFAR